MPHGHRFNACAWLFLMTALALHVLDEAMNGFLPLYNETASGIQQRLGLGPPTFTFPVWLGGLTAGVLIGYLLTPWIARGGTVPRVFATAFGALMVLNALGHLAGSIALGYPMPGVWSSPVLGAAAGWVVWRGIASAWGRRSAGHE